MNNFNFGDVLTRAWQIIWKHKILWIFGILTGCGQSGYNFRVSRSFESSNGTLPPQLSQFFQNIQDHLTGFIALIIGLFCVIWIVVTFLSTIGRIGLIRGGAQADAGTEKLIFGQLFSESMPYFWRMFWLSLILALPFLLLFIMLMAGFIVLALTSSQNGDAVVVGILTMVPLFIGCVCLLIPIMFVVGMVFRQAERAIVLEELAVMPALSRGWDVFRNNLGPIILLAIILAIVGGLAGFLFALPVFIIVFPAMFAFILGNAENYSPLIFAAVCFCLYLPVLWTLNGIMISYIETTWTLTYIRLTGKPGDTNNAGPVAPEPVLPEDSEKTVLARPNA